MKKRFIITLLAALLCLALPAGCGVTTITEQPGNYVYRLNEPIDVIDIESRETLGILTVTGVEVLLDEPFDVQENDGEDKAGKPILKTVTYSRIVQVFYTYTGSKRISGGNFTVWDSGNIIGKNPEGMEPKPAYTPQAKKGQSSFTTALLHPEGPLDINFSYNFMQLHPTARIQVELI